MNLKQNVGYFNQQNPHIKFGDWKPLITCWKKTTKLTYIIFQNEGCGNQFHIKGHGVGDFQVDTYHGHDVWQGEDKFILWHNYHK